DHLDAALAAHLGLAVWHEFDIATEHHLHSPVDTGVALWEGLARLVGHGCHGIAPDLVLCEGIGVVRPGIGVPRIFCYDCHCSSPHARGWVEGQVLSLPVAHLAFSLA